MNTRYRIDFALIFSVMIIVLSSCAKEVIESTDTLERRILEAHISVVYKDTLQTLPSGVYLMNRKKGSGKEVKANSSVFVRYSKLSLKNVYEQTSVEEIAKNVGGFAYANYYGPVLFELGNITMMKGMEEAFLKLREGSDVRMIIPPWASELDYKGSDRQLPTSAVYDFEILKVIDDYPQYELDSLHMFSSMHYQGLDSLVKGFYFKSLKEGTGDSVKVGNTIRYNYVGKLLNGFVFDTNIEDTARKYRIYSSEKQYNPISHEVHEVGQSGSGGSSVVDGFAKALLNMKLGGKAVTFFGSEWGYGSGNQSFGKRQQIHFYIEVLE